LEKFDANRGASTKEIKYALRNDGKKYKSKSIKDRLYKLEDKKVVTLFLGRWILTGKNIKDSNDNDTDNVQYTKNQEKYALCICKFIRRNRKKGTHPMNFVQLASRFRKEGIKITNLKLLTTLRKLRKQKIVRCVCGFNRLTGKPFITKHDNIKAAKAIKKSKKYRSKQKTK
jgi:hypothetical protein